MRRPLPLRIAALVAVAAIAVIVALLAAADGPVARLVEGVRPAPAPTDRHIALVDGGSARPLAPDELVELDRDLSATFRLTSQGGGEHLLHLRLFDGAGRPVANVVVASVVEMRYMEHGRAESVGQAEGAGSYVVPVALAMSGEWRLTLSIRAGSASATVRLDFDDYR